ncbi:MAG: hypothetical protein C0399_05710 [Syntrophus sp. (in: bacteria)]|nr:hypothetical protein [Syntrophus sp. (in: bacteria)]
MKLSREAIHEAGHAAMALFFCNELTAISLNQVEYRTPNSTRKEFSGSLRSRMNAIQDIMITSAGMLSECLFVGSSEFWKKNFPIEMSGDYIQIRDTTRKEKLQGELKAILVQTSNLLSLPSMIQSVIEIATNLEAQKMIDHSPTTEKGKRHLKAITDEILHGIENTEFPEDEVSETYLSKLQDDAMTERALPQLHGTASLIEQIIMSIDEGIGE